MCLYSRFVTAYYEMILNSMKLNDNRINVSYKKLKEHEIYILNYIENFKYYIYIQ